MYRVIQCTLCVFTAGRGGGKVVWKKKSACWYKCTQWLYLSGSQIRSGNLMNTTSFMCSGQMLYYKLQLHFPPWLQCSSAPCLLLHCNQRLSAISSWIESIVWATDPGFSTSSCCNDYCDSNVILLLRLYIFLLLYHFIIYYFYFTIYSKILFYLLITKMGVTNLFSIVRPLTCMTVTAP